MTGLPPVSAVRSGLADVVSDIKADLARGIPPETAVNTLRGLIPTLFNRHETALMLAVAIVELAERGNQ